MQASLSRHFGFCAEAILYPCNIRSNTTCITRLPQRDSCVQVALLSITACGQGLNLQVGHEQLAAVHHSGSQLLGLIEHAHSQPCQQQTDLGPLMGPQSHGGTASGVINPCLSPQFSTFEVLNFPWIHHKQHDVVLGLLF